VRAHVKQHVRLQQISYVITTGTPVPQMEQASNNELIVQMRLLKKFMYCVTQYNIYFNFYIEIYV